MSSGVWHRTLVYLGLREEPEEGYDELPERSTAVSVSEGRPDPRPGDRSGDRSGDRRPGEGRGGDPAGGSSRSRGGPERFDPAGDPDAAAVRRAPLRTAPASSSATSVPADSNVRPLRASDVPAPTARLAVVEIARFDDVEQVGSRYRTGQPVLFDVAQADRVDARRVIDFVAGLTYALRGSMRRVGTRAYLLVPDGVVLPDDERRRIETLGYVFPAEGSR